MVLSFRKRAIVAAIQEYIDEHNYAPTIRELCQMVGLKSASTMHRHLEDLRAAGVVTWEPGSPRTLTVVESGSHAV